MKFVYTGEAPNGSIQQYGYTFVPNQPVDVTDDFAIRKLSVNQFFKVARIVREAASDEPEEPAPEATKKGRPKKAAAKDDGSGGGAG